MTPAEALRLVAAANPVSTGSLTIEAAEQRDRLLARLRGGQFGSDLLPDAMGAGRRRRRLLAVVVAGVVAVAVAGIALADNGQPFTSIAAFVGIGSADHARSGRDVLDPQAAKAVERENSFRARAPARLKRMLPLLRSETARLIGHLPGGSNVYALENSNGDLCVISTKYGSFCTRPLGSGVPVTVGQERRSSRTAPIAWGLARDDVGSVSFRASGREVTVPVENNVWFYVGENNALGKLSIHYTDGNSKTLDFKHRHRR